ncbi:MAG: hypothetical protein RIS63_676 [Bacteroidota bacterium]
MNGLYAKLKKLSASKLGGATIWNLLGTVVPLTIGLFTIPIILLALDIERFGVLSLIWAGIGYIGFFDFGLGRALIQVTASHRAFGVGPPRSTLLGVILLALAISLVGGALIFLLADKIAVDWLSVSLEIREEVIVAFQLMGFGVPVVALSSVLRGIIEGFEDFKKSAILRGSLGIANFVGPYVLILFGLNDLASIVFVLVLTRIVNLGHTVYYTLKYTYSKVDQSESIPSIVKFGFWTTVANIVGPVMSYMDRYLIATFGYIGSIAYYSVPQDLISRIVVVPGSLASALFPRIAFLYKTQRTKAIETYLGSLKWTFFVMVFITLMAAVLARLGLTIWLGSEFAEKALPVFYILIFGLFANGLAVIPANALQALGRMREAALIVCFEVIIYLPSLYYAVLNFGLRGAAIVWSARLALDFIILHSTFIYFVKNREV